MTTVGCVVVRLRALVARYSLRLIRKRPIENQSNPRGLKLQERTRLITVQMHPSGEWILLILPCGFPSPPCAGTHKTAPMEPKHPNTETD
jgi:hypothetical protein